MDPWYWEHWLWPVTRLDGTTFRPIGYVTVVGVAPYVPTLRVAYLPSSYDPAAGLVEWTEAEAEVAMGRPASFSGSAWPLDHTEAREVVEEILTRARGRG